MGLRFAREISGAGLHQELIPLLQEHYDEIAQFKDIPLKPDFLRYDAIEKAGALRVYTARDDGRLVGYAIFIVGPHLHYKTSLQAVQDVLFLTEKLRRGLSGLKFIKWCDKMLASDGVQVVCQHVKKARDFGKVLLRLGYRHADTLYVRRLD